MCVAHYTEKCAVHTQICWCASHTRLGVRLETRLAHLFRCVIHTSIFTVNTYQNQSKNSEIDGYGINYTISYFDPKSGYKCGSTNLLSSSCEKELCNHTFEICSSTCLPASDILARVSATNMLGEGPTKSATIASNSDTVHEG